MIGTPMRHLNALFRQGIVPAEADEAVGPS